MARSPFKHNVGKTTYSSRDLKTLMAKTTPLPLGDHLAGIAARHQTPFTCICTDRYTIRFQSKPKKATG